MKLEYWFFRLVRRVHFFRHRQWIATVWFCHDTWASVSGSDLLPGEWAEPMVYRYWLTRG